MRRKRPTAAEKREYEAKLVIAQKLNEKVIVKPCPHCARKKLYSGYSCDRYRNYLFKKDGSLYRNIHCKCGAGGVMGMPVKIWNMRRKPRA